jgi:DNA-binding XRE family transcriptional regulator
LPEERFARNKQWPLSLAHRDAIVAMPMPRRERRSLRLLFSEARQALGMSQREFGHALGASHRTASRWDAGHAQPYEDNLRELVPLLHPRNRALAAEVADHLEETLVSLGLEAPPPPPSPPVPPPAPAPPPVRPEDLVDVLVLTAVEMTGAPPAAMRAMLHAVFRRGREVGLTVEGAEKALHASLTTPAEADATGDKRDRAGKALTGRSGG